jgi:hypothetical protein
MTMTSIHNHVSVWCDGAGSIQTHLIKLQAHHPGLRGDCGCSSPLLVGCRHVLGAYHKNSGPSRMMQP